MKHELMYCARVAEAHLGLGRVHIHIDHAGVDIDEQHISRLALVVQHIGIGLANRVRQQFIAHKATVDEQVLAVAPGTRIARQRNPAADRKCRTALADFDTGIGEFLTEHRAHARERIAGRVQPQAASVVGEAERDLGHRDRDA